MTTEQKGELIAKLEEASTASMGGQHHVANMYIQDARAILHGTPATPPPAPAEAAEAGALAWDEETEDLKDLLSKLRRLDETRKLPYKSARDSVRREAAGLPFADLAALAAARLAATPAAADAVVAHKDALIAIREWHEDCEYSVLKRGDKDYIQAANYAPEYMRAVNLLLNIISPTDGKCVACNAVRYVLPGQVWGSCSNNECATYKEDVASASYLDEAPPCAAH